VNGLIIMSRYSTPGLFGPVEVCSREGGVVPGSEESSAGGGCCACCASWLASWASNLAILSASCTNSRWSVRPIQGVTCRSRRRESTVYSPSS